MLGIIAYCYINYGGGGAGAPQSTSPRSVISEAVFSQYSNLAEAIYKSNASAEFINNFVSIHTLETIFGHQINLTSAMIEQVLVLIQTGTEQRVVQANQLFISAGIQYNSLWASLIQEFGPEATWGAWIEAPLHCLSNSTLGVESLYGLRELSHLCREEIVQAALRLNVVLPH